MNNAVKKLRSGLIFVAFVIMLLGFVSFFRFVIEFSNLDQFGEIDSDEIRGMLTDQWLQQLAYLFGDISQSLLCLFAAHFIKPLGDKS